MGLKEKKSGGINEAGMVEKKKTVTETVLEPHLNLSYFYQVL